MTTLNHFVALDIQVKNDTQNVFIHWADGHHTYVPIQRLRGYCPCAECQGHRAQICFRPNQTHTILSANIVGRYAINFRFADGHNTGIFRFETLRKLDPTEELRWGTPEISLSR